jgi:hypothetical protein
VLIFDIETAPIADAAAYLPPQSAPANYKDPEKIAAYVAEARAAALEKAALDPWLLRVVAIGLQQDDAEPVALIARTIDEERTILARFWHMAATQFQTGGQLVGFNVLAFDLPALIQRSRLIGVKPELSTLKKYGQFGVTDLADRLTIGGILPMRSLGWYCQRIGVDVHDETSGKDMPGFVADGNWTAVESHVRADIAKTVALAAWCGVAPF